MGFRWQSDELFNHTNTSFTNHAVASSNDKPIKYDHIKATPYLAGVEPAASAPSSQETADENRNS
jgi:hypothetical protein